MNHIPNQLKKTLEKKYTSYVLITCDPPSEKGEMNVQMSYEGDAALVAYMIDGAQAFLEVQNE